MTNIIYLDKYKQDVLDRNPISIHTLKDCYVCSGCGRVHNSNESLPVICSQFIEECL